ncbi:ribbon-helix-helix protein, CopG family [Mycobacterium hodleri]|uniref:Ribbon-helix-helix protein, CopG family n=1 Tax=Mycolicibacterium hodleri TaxID=49897 RepID=A0A544VQJ9_9MYCO|nr:ribbon-helix-helix protein, CopG family [Mycolicibacterium hodleri]TQR82271.1 ribbon-helix-helix protein, CopG family [Mycolicibacterium hodleri]
MAKTKDAALQARVSPEFAKKFNAIAKARGKSTSELVREAVEKMADEADTHLASMQEELERRHREEREALASARSGGVPAAETAEG